ncbi:MAG: hypothetical protein KQA36_03465 [Candidatus Aenigmarchaeota archaeon]|nr:hypothetical protein [Candidatus Aenigmarchaeota archaeon]
MKTKNIELFFISILFTASIVNAQQIEITECSSGKEPWVCYSNELCICRISGICTDGILMIYKGSIQDAFCFPSIEKGIAAIYLDDCNNPREEIKVRASCLEGNSAEKTIKIEEKVERASTTTTIATRETTTIRECSKLGDSCAYQNCCEGLYCCSDMVCKESCEEERSETNLWLIIIPVIGLLIIVASFVIIKRRGEIE